MTKMLSAGTLGGGHTFGGGCNIERVRYSLCIGNPIERQLYILIKKGNAPGGSSFQTLHARSFSVRETKTLMLPWDPSTLL